MKEDVGSFILATEIFQVEAITKIIYGNFYGEKIVNQEIVLLFILSNSSDELQLFEVYFCLSIAYRRDPE